jgi:L-threonylcarbamoyladenylate synthase
LSYYTKEFDERVAELMRRGGIGFMPSDTVYGLTGRALDQTAVEKIYNTKSRAADKPVITLISSLEMLDLLSISGEEAKPAESYWPGPLTIICSAPAAPAWLRRHGQTLAVRMPDYPQLLKLIDQTGPLVSTSANLQAQPPVTSAAEAQRIFGERLDFYVDKGQLADRQPSTIVKMEANDLKIIRQGAIEL